MSRLRAPLVVAAARLRAHCGRSLLVALGVAAATTMLLGVIGGSLVARDRAVARSLRALPAADRSFRVDAFGLPSGEDYAAADARARSALRLLAPGAPLRATFFRELRIDRELTQLVGLDDLAQFVRLRAGRLPRVCTPARCEVLQIGAAGRERLDEGDIHIVRVGIADVPRRAVFGSSLESLRIGGDAPVLLIASGGHAFDALPAFDGIFRTYSWIAPVDPSRLHVWDITHVLERETRAQGDLARAGDVFRLSGPDQALLDARAGGRVSAQRMVLVGGEASTLLLGFALVVAVGMRRGLANESRRLRQRGASWAQTFVAAAAEIGMLTLAGTLLGVGVGVAVVSLLAGGAGLPRLAVLGHSLSSPTSVGAVIGAWLISTVGLIVVARARDAEATRRIGLLDVAALGAVGAVVLGLARGGLDSATLSSGGNRALLLLLPGLVCFVAAVVVTRLLRPLMRVGERIARRSDALVPRLALLALSRSPARTTATTAFLVVALGLAFFAASWRATLDRGARDQAAFQVPLDVTLTEGLRVVQPLDVASVGGYEALAPGVTAFPVVRRLGDVAGQGASVASPTLLGLPAAAIHLLHWRSDFSSVSQDELARRLGADGPATLRGVVVPASPSEPRVVSVRVTVRGVPVQLDLAVRDRTGRLTTVSLGERPAETWRLAARLARSVTEVVALEISLAPSEQLGFNHRDAESVAASVPAGSASLGPLLVGTRPVTDWRGFVGRHGLRVREGSPLRVDYAFTAGQTMVLRRPQPTDGRALRVIVSPDIARSAGPGGALVVDLQGTVVPATVVGVASRFPAAQEQDEGFVIADESRLRTVLDSDMPGTGTPGELWLAARDPASLAAALDRPRFASLDIASRAAIERSLVGDPLARGITIALGVAAAVALALAVLGLWIALVSELRDERGELFDLEAQGVSPRVLRRQLRLRAGLLLAFALVAGTLLGWALSRLVVSAVDVSATGAPAKPPLELDLGWGVAGLALAVLVLVSALAVELTTCRAFGGAAPERSSWSLE